ncbi:MAG: hypothetical protein HY716_00870 [Planctomycetes bacterium]|nr:hypothetical protein [Planctomycetota bacterium]
MVRVLVSTDRFRRAYHKLAEPQQRLVDEALRQLAQVLKSNHTPVGLGLKKLGPGVFEVRAGLALRIVYVQEGSKVALALLGNHDDVRRFLRRQ